MNAGISLIIILGLYIGVGVVVYFLVVQPYKKGMKKIKREYREGVEKIEKEYQEFLEKEMEEKRPR